ncbi:aspartate-semialdehyde dehydrogenase [Motilimonas sp. 1_MG-2023]|uniref:aspartate-semialdehyde dehydrogenase n=1 Tax=Motilimonas sp. 1_MG-2023 TaxID=3062672 RepID=UPI0026E24877|nr:aspartate-semialdehyde dehydrogenase [Motilimonas sp. 1_MG-2023]MDO6526640.1 aspartate-semialdehyde dehydrogenase [Motilimonas sp. 1_MG-2023]
MQLIKEEMTLQDRVNAISKDILSSSQKNEYKGADPFDGLNSKFFNLFPSLKKGYFGLAWIQFHKRSVVNFRDLFFIPKGRNPKGIGLFILGLIEQYKKTNSSDYLNEAIELADWLLTVKSDVKEWGHACWGYHFDWNARAFFVPKGKPNVITTIYVSQALLALSELTNNNEYKNAAIDAAYFIKKSLLSEVDGKPFIAYIPGEKAFVHNASLWGAAWLAKVSTINQDSELATIALDVAKLSVDEQGEDGSWVYGHREHHQFIDGFHSGYNLEALHLIKESLNTDIFDESIAKGLDYYRKSFFSEEGAAKYYNNNQYPLDMHSVSQAIFTLLKVGGTAEDIKQVEKTINWSIDKLYLNNKKKFIYQKTPLFTNSTNYIRWTQAWVFYSFSYFSNQRNAINENN